MALSSGCIKFTILDSVCKTCEIASEKIAIMKDYS